MVSAPHHREKFFFGAFGDIDKLSSYIHKPLSPLKSPKKNSSIFDKNKPTVFAHATPRGTNKTKGDLIMKKIVYAITQIGKKENFKMSGIGYITDEDIVIACVSKQNKPYVRVFENAVKDCYLVRGSKDEYKGAYSEIKEVPLTDDKGNVTDREIEVNYWIWYKLAD